MSVGFRGLGFEFRVQGLGFQFSVKHALVLPDIRHSNPLKYPDMTHNMSHMSETSHAPRPNSTYSCPYIIKQDHVLA